MDIELQALKFANILDIAGAAASGGNVYDKQEQLVNRCREAGIPFIASMPMRHMVKCKECGVQKGDSILHFENPNVKFNESIGDLLFGTPKGLHFQLNESDLHGILAHGYELPGMLNELLASVDC